MQGAPKVYGGKNPFRLSLRQKDRMFLTTVTVRLA